MKAILEFELPEDEDQFTVAARGMDLYLALWDIDQYLRSVIQHGVDTDKIQPFSAAHIRERLYEILEGRNLNLDMVS